MKVCLEASPLLPLASSKLEGGNSSQGKLMVLKEQKFMKTVYNVSVGSMYYETKITVELPMPM